MTPPAEDKAPSVRTLRMGEAVRHALAEILARDEVHDETLDGRLISVTEVRMSPDLRVATAYVKPLLGRDEAATLKALRTHTAYFQRAVAKKVNARFVAKIRFIADESFDEGSHIDRLLKAPHIARDLET